MELIDRKALNMHLADIQLANRGWKDDFCDILDDIMQMVDDMPTIDAVPVVRCKDCEHMTEEMCLRYCNVWQVINGYGDDGFCCYGERRCEDAAD